MKQSVMVRKVPLKRREVDRMLEEHRIGNLPHISVIRDGVSEEVILS